MRARGLSLLLGLLFACSLALDFDDVEDLPCPCDDQHVCIEATGRCVRIGSVDPFRSCRTDTPFEGDELCPSGHRCAAVNGQGPRCLPQCEVVPYARPEAGRLVAEQCGAGTTCWTSTKGGVCSEGICQDNPNNCPSGSTCVRFNQAGVCFVTCSIFQQNPLPCAGNQICHPIGESSVTACVDSGNISEVGVCTNPGDGFCQRTGSGNRPLICARPLSTSNRELFCRPICNPADGTGCVGSETCPVVRLNIDPRTPLNLGICNPSTN